VIILPLQKYTGTNEILQRMSRVPDHAPFSCTNVRKFYGNRFLHSYILVNHILIIGSVYLCHAEHASYFLSPCDNRPPARPARIPLADTLCGYCTVISVSSALYAVVATLTRMCSITQTDATAFTIIRPPRSRCGLLLQTE